MTTNEQEIESPILSTLSFGEVWLVIGETGEYEDHQEWLAAGFFKITAAEEFRQLCQAEADKVNGKGHEAQREFKHPLDIEFACDGYTHYRIQRVPMFHTTPEAVEDARRAWLTKQKRHAEQAFGDVLYAVDGIESQTKTITAELKESNAGN